MRSWKIPGKVMSRQTHGIYEFGSFRLDAQERLLQRDGATISLTPKAFDLLLALVERHGRLVEKEELFKAVWPDTIVEESNLSSNIALIRKALGDGETGLKFIETVPKSGYRFVAKVREVKGLATWSAKADRAQGLEEDQQTDQSTGQIGQSAGCLFDALTEGLRVPAVSRPQDEFKPKASSRKSRYLLALSSLVIFLCALAYSLLFVLRPNRRP
jgi:DNA-binding winged helix-turn-helix (wHTH) protein